MTDKGHHIKERFPDKVSDLSIRMAEDPSFLDLCEDYDVCVNALQYWSRSTEPEARDRVDEYRSLSREIENEIAQAIELHKPGMQPD
jgi:hypothetical protein